MSLAASLAQGTGTQTMGRGSIALGTVTIGNTQRVAGQLQGSGSITLTTVTATRVVGSFTFTAQAVAGDVAGDEDGDVGCVRRDVLASAISASGLFEDDFTPL